MIIPQHTKEAAQTIPQTVSMPKIAKTKWDQCRAIYIPEVSRNAMLERFIEDIGCTKAGAATYYYKCKKLYG